MIRLVVLGSGGGVPTPERNLPAIGLRYFGDVYLFDCGEGTQRQMMRCKLSYMKTKAIFVTHCHADHVLGIPGLLQTMDMAERTEPLEIYGPAGLRGCMESLLSCFRCGFDVRISEAGEGVCFSNDEFTVSAFFTEHSARSLGYVFEQTAKRRFDEKKAKAAGLRGRMFTDIEKAGTLAIGKKKVALEDVTYLKQGKKIVYTGDTVYSQGVVRAAKNADLLIHDAMFAEEHAAEAREKKHCTAAEAAEAAKKAKAKRLLLTHISARYDDASALLAEAKKTFENAELAHDGMEILL